MPVDSDYRNAIQKFLHNIGWSNIKAGLFAIRAFREDEGCCSMGTSLGTQWFWDLAKAIQEPPPPGKCPKCGSDAIAGHPDDEWALGKCGSSWDHDGLLPIEEGLSQGKNQTPQCRIRELEQVVEMLYTSLQNIRDKGTIEPRSPRFFRTLANRALAAADKEDG